MSTTDWGAVLTMPVAEDRDHVQGPANAVVTLVEYGDYECPYCGAAYPIIKEVQARIGERLRFVFRNFPITTSHPHAEQAAEAAEAAATQRRFWQMHDLLYENQRRLRDQDLRAHAEKLGLDVESFDKELAEHVHAARVREDFMSGVRSGVNGTPTFYVNGARHDDSYDIETLLAALERGGVGMRDEMKDGLGGSTRILSDASEKLRRYGVEGAESGRSGAWRRSTRSPRIGAPGAEAQQAITDVGGGKLIASVKDADGNVIGLVQSP